MNCNHHARSVNRRDGGARARPRRRATCVVALAAVVLAFTAAVASAQGLTVQVSPARVDVAAGGTAAFTARVYDSEGNEVAADLAWSVIPPRLGRVADGVFVAGNEEGRGIVRVAASYEGRQESGHAIVVIGRSSGRLSVVVTPRHATLSPSGEQMFEAEVTDPNTGKTVAAEVEWSVIPEGLGTVDALGQFSASDHSGSGRVVARAWFGAKHGLGDAGVVVGAGAPAGSSVEVVPRRMTVRNADGVRFRAVVRDASGADVEADVVWDVVPSSLGSIAGDGLFVAGPDGGQGRVVATVVAEDGPVRGFAEVVTRSGEGSGPSLQVRPHELAVAPGGDAVFSVELAGETPGGDMEPVEWTVEPRWLGTISHDGFFVAAESFPAPTDNGSWVGTVTASIETGSGRVRDAARVRVREDGARRIRVLPRRATVSPDEEIQFELEVMDAGDLNDWTTEWAVFPERLGTITPDGLFVASRQLGDPISGEFGAADGIVGARVTLADGSVLIGAARVSIDLPAGSVRIVVHPGFAVVAPGRTQRFEATLRGEDGRVLDLPVEWRVAPRHLGEISPDGVFTASEAGIDPSSWQRPTGQVVAEFTTGGGIVARGAAALVIDLPDPEVLVTVMPSSITLDAGDSFTFEATAQNADGAPIEVPLEWRVEDNAVGSVTQDGTFTAAVELPPGHARRTRVIAGLSYGGRVYWDHATVRVARQD